MCFIKCAVMHIAFVWVIRHDKSVKTWALVIRGIVALFHIVQNILFRQTFPNHMKYLYIRNSYFHMIDQARKINYDNYEKQFYRIYNFD